MSQEALLIYKKLGLSEESSWAQGTITAATKLLALRQQGIVIGANPTIIKPPRISGRASLKKAMLGTIAPKMTVPFFGFPTGLSGKIIKGALGQSVDAEVASFVVQTGVNDTIDFNIGASNLVATVAAGTYPAGLSQADSGTTLCKLIYNAITGAEGAGTYTVTYSTTTKKFTITRSAGTFQMKFLTGPNTAKTMAPLLGYTTTDHTGALTYTSDNAVEHVFSHTMHPLDAIAYGLTTGFTFQIALGNSKVFDVTDSVIDELKFAYKPNEEVAWDATVEARKVANSAASLSALTEETTDPLLFTQLAFTYGGVSLPLEALTWTLKNNYAKGLFVNSQYRSKFVRNGFRDVTGTFTVEIADSTAFAIWDAFLAGSAQPALVSTFTGPVIKGALNYSCTVTHPKVQYDLKDVPGGGGAAVPKAPISFIALDDGTNGEVYVVIQNNEATI